MKRNALLSDERRKRGWSQKLLADFATVSLSTIERAERGEPIRIDSIERICDCLEKRPEELGLIQQEALSPAIEKNKEPQLVIPLAMPINSFGIYQITTPLVGSEVLNTIAQPTNIFDFGVLARLERALMPRPKIDPAAVEQLRLIVTELEKQLVQGKLTNWQGLLYTGINHLGLYINVLESAWNKSPELITLIGETCLLLGDVSFNLHDYDNATRYYEMALRAAQEASNIALHAISAGRYGLLLIDTKNLAQAEQLLIHALTISHQHISSILCSWLWAVKAEVHASKQETKLCYESLEAAREQLNLKKERMTCYTFSMALVPSVYGTTKLLGFEGACHLRLKNHKEAQRVLAASQKQSAHAHHQSLIHIDFARSFLHEASPQDAAVHASQALDYIQQTGSQRAFQRVLSIKQDLHRWWNLPEVQELNERITVLSKEGV